MTNLGVPKDLLDTPASCPSEVPTTEVNRSSPNSIPVGSASADGLSTTPVQPLLLSNSTTLPDVDVRAAQTARAGMTEFPVVLTRSLDTARDWLRHHTRGNRRCGLVASSGARRLRPHGIDVRSEFDDAHWFLSPPEDVRSSNYRELAATEFHVQGLELDWTALCWDADLRPTPSGWQPWRFQGTTWKQVRHPRTHQYMLNKYRVLLTRARQGLVL
jgi:hypothetical protein